MDALQDGIGIFRGSKKQVCSQCGTEMVYFVQHAHGNYPLLDYVCPRCDLGLEDEELTPDEGEGPPD